MKRILVAIFLAFGLWELSYAVSMDTWRSSNTVTSDTTKNLCPGQFFIVNGSSVSFGNRGVLHGVCVNTGISAGSITVFDSSATATSSAIPIATISTSTGMPCSFYDVGISSGLTYTKNGTADVTILYQCF